MIEVSVVKPDEWRKFPSCLKKLLSDMKWGFVVPSPADELQVLNLVPSLETIKLQVRFLIILNLVPSLETIRTKEFHVMSLKILMVKDGFYVQTSLSNADQFKLERMPTQGGFR